mgnify:CR=1 FL=1|jgi:hypothetical protein
MKLDLEDFDQNFILMKIKKNEFFKGLNCFFLYNYAYDDCPSLEIYTQADGLNTANTYITEDINLLSFLYGLDLLGANSFHINEINDPKIPIPTYTNRNIENLLIVVKSINSLSSLEKNKLLSSIRYFSRSLRLTDLELYEESFLTYFKSIEIICDHIYNQQFKSLFNDKIKIMFTNFIADWYEEEFQTSGSDNKVYKDLKKLLNSLETKRRILIRSLKYLDIQDTQNIGELVQLRNSIGAHGNTEVKKINQKNVQEIAYLTHLVISKYLLGDNYLNCIMKGSKNY